MTQQKLANLADIRGGSLSEWLNYKGDLSTIGPALMQVLVGEDDAALAKQIRTCTSRVRR